VTTFSELSVKVNDLTNRRTVLNHIVEYIEQNFRTNGSSPKNTLLRKDKLAVPESSFELVVKEMLEEIQAIDSELEKINASSLEEPVTPKTKTKN
jgi:hypothetical protein